jgi:hypothetical protein
MDNQPRNTYIAIGVIILVVVGLFFLAWHFSGPSTPASAPQADQSQNPSVQGATAVQTTYECDNNFSIDAKFSGPQGALDIGTHLDLSLSDGRTISLDEIQTEDGQKYTNADQSTTFTILGPNATLLDNGQTVGGNCIEPKG